MTEYTTLAGDVVDDVCFRFYGRTDGRLVERVLDANPHLADHGPVLPAGVVLSLPAFTPEPAASRTVVKLWE